MARNLSYKTAIRKSGFRDAIEQSAQLEQQGKLSPLMFLWLRQGHCTPILSVKPARLIKMVVSALEQAGVRPTAPHGQTPDAEEQAQTYARRVGFMTWPG